MGAAHGRDEGVRRRGTIRRGGATTAYRYDGSLVEYNANPLPDRGLGLGVHQLQVAERDMEATPDGELVQQHLDGDSGAFEMLYRQYFQRLVRLCAARTNDVAAAEDLAQETLLRALSNMDRFQMDRPMWPWLKTIATRLVIDQARQRRAELDPDPGSAQAVEDETGWLEERPILAEALKGIPGRQRVALALRYLDDWSPAEAAEALGLSRPAFDQLLFRARGKLRREYQRVCGESPTRLRVAVWPLLAVLARLRQQAVRTRAVAEGWTSSFQMTGEAMTSIVVAATISAAAVGAAIAVKPPMIASAADLETVTVTAGPAAAEDAALAAASNFTAWAAGQRTDRPTVVRDAVAPRPAEDRVWHVPTPKAQWKTPAYPDAGTTPLRPNVQIRRPSPPSAEAPAVTSPPVNPPTATAPALSVGLDVPSLPALPETPAVQPSLRTPNASQVKGSVMDPPAPDADVSVNVPGPSAPEVSAPDADVPPISEPAVSAPEHTFSAPHHMQMM